jgi:hypothetical protein
LILIVASQVDDAARRLLADFPPGESALLTCRDLSSPGWHVSSMDARAQAVVAGGACFAASRITGVLTVLPCVFERELVHIEEEDREYVASEMTAFLLYWLSGLRCPLLNRPTAGCLSGPNWRVEQWARLAAQLGIPAVPHSRATAGLPTAGAETERTQVTVVGQQFCGAPDETLRYRTRALAQAAGVDMLTAAFLCDSGLFAGTEPLADLDSLEVRRAIVRFFEERA